MLRKLYILLGFALGALFVWSLTHNARKTHAEKEARRKKYAPVAAHFHRELEMQSAIDGVDYTSDEYWEQELAQYKDKFEKWEKGIFDEDEQ